MEGEKEEEWVVRRELDRMVVCGVCMDGWRVVGVLDNDGDDVRYLYLSIGSDTFHKLREIKSQRIRSLVLLAEASPRGGPSFNQ